MSLLRRFWLGDRSLSVLLLLLGVAIFVVHPLGGLGVAGRAVIGLFFSLILISGVGAVAKNAWTTTLIGTLVLTTLSVRWVRLWRGGASLMLPDTLFSSLFCVTLAAVVTAQVFREGPITLHRIQGAIAVYLLIGLAFAYLYEFIGLRWPHAFVPVALANVGADEDPTSRFLYFSFVTLTTVGFGDITPAHPMARSLVTMEALIGQLFPSVLIARLVSMELHYRQRISAERR